MRTVGCKSATATRFGHFMFHHTAFSLISIVLVTNKALGAFSPTHSKPELQNRGHVVLKSPSGCCHAYRKFNQKPLKYGHLHIPDTHTWSQWCPHWRGSTVVDCNIQYSNTSKEHMGYASAICLTRLCRHIRIRACIK